jgi:hypothetical protein
MKQYLLLLIILLVAITNLSATNYYISNNGNDSTAGTSTLQPWKTIAKVNSIRAILIAGDSIFFERGSVFHETIVLTNVKGSSVKNIYIGAYGIGEKPIISGGKPITGWSVYSGNIYQATLGVEDSIIKAVHVNGQRLENARFPNSGFGFIQARIGNPGVGIRSADLNGKTSNYWENGKVTIRSARWIYETREITSSSNDTINFASTSVNDYGYEWGFYVENVFDELDTAGEWYFDKLNRTLYIWLPDNQNPNLSSIVATTKENGLVIDKTDNSGCNPDYARWLTISDIYFNYHYTASVYGVDNRDVVIQNCTFNNLEGNGIWYNSPCAGNAYNTIRNNHFKHIRIGGLKMHNIRFSTIENNQFDTILEYATTFTGSPNIIKRNTINGNTLIYTGGGIGVNGDSNIVERNYIDQQDMAWSDDYGGIYMIFSGTGTIIKDNVIKNIKSLTAGVPSIYNSYGIYLDAQSDHVTVLNNTIIGCGGGINVHCDNHYHTFRNNVVYACKKGQMVFNRTDVSPAGDITNHQAYNNVLFAAHPSSYVLELKSTTDFINSGVFDSNYYFNPFNAEKIIRNYEPDDNTTNEPNASGSFPKSMEYFTLAGWQSASGNDVHSKSDTAVRAYFTNVTETAAPVFTSTFNSSTDGFMSYVSPTPAIAPLTWDNGRLKIAYSEDGSILMVFTGVFPIEKGKYKISFDVENNDAGNGGFNVVIARKTNYKGIMNARQFSVNNALKHIEFIEEVTESTTEGRLEFRVSKYTGTLYLDNIKIVSVTTDTVDVYEQYPIFVNYSNQTENFSLSDNYSDLDGNIMGGSLSLPPWTSKILIKKDTEPVSINEISIKKSEHTFICYPNPVNKGQLLNIKTKQNNFNISFYSLCGIHICSFNNTSEIYIDERFKPGVYIVKINLKNKYLYEKIIIR